MGGTTATVLAVGDLILYEPEPDSFFELAAPTLKSGDVVIGHVEVPHTRRGQKAVFEISAEAADPEHLRALPAAGFNVATVAGNHTFDQGAPGVEDTLATLRELGLPTAGAGMTLEEARRPAILERSGLRFGVLSYNCVGPKLSWAARDKAGAAYVHVISHYELDNPAPGGPPTVYTFAVPEILEAMQDDVEALREQCDVVTVSLHKGIGHTRAKVAWAEKQIARAAIDAGADAVFGHHAHILRGIELYKGKPIYHGLGNFVTVTRLLSYTANAPAEHAEWARKRRELYGFEPDPEYPLYPFHPESKQTIIAKCVVDGRGNVEARYIPCYVNKRYQPEVLRRDERGQQVFDYVEQITREAGLSATFAWEGDEVIVRPGPERKRAARGGQMPAREGGA